MIKVDQYKEFRSLVDAGHSLDDVIESFLFFAYMKHGTVTKAAKETGASERMIHGRGIKPRSAEITELEAIVDARVLLDSVEQKRFAPETPQECGLRE